MKKVELLSPAGSMEAFHGALNAGCDAVYLAGRQFGARAYAQNFTEEELKDVLKEAHLFHVKVYLTVNILTKQEELPDLVCFVSRLYESGLDGVIVQDLGVAETLRQTCPELLLHASTQMSVTGRTGAQFLLDHGFSRVVPARELSLQEIRLLKETGIEVEAFIHGAMCYSYSGRCLMSGFLGGRSGNRGRCAGPCRLPYEVLDENHEPIVFPSAESMRSQSGCGNANDGIVSSNRFSQQKGSRGNRHSVLIKQGRNGRDGGDPHRVEELQQTIYPLSMRDMCVLPILPDLMDAGIDSFKIEGRMKKPEYTAGTTAVYRKYIDRFYDWDQKGRPGKWTVDPDDLKELYQLYIRTELSTGYYHERNGWDMITLDKPGYAGADPDRLDEIRRQYIDHKRQIPITGAAVIRAGHPAIMKTDFHNCSCVTSGATAEEAQNRPLTEDGIRGRLMKTGDSSFVFQNPEDLQVETDGHSFLPVSKLNELRRDALCHLEEELLKPYSGRTARHYPISDRTSSGLSSSTAEKEQSQGQNQKRERNNTCQLRMVMVQTMRQALAALEFHPDILVLDGTLRDHPDELIRRYGYEDLPYRSDSGFNCIEEGNSDEAGINNESSGDRLLIMAALPFVLRASDESWLRGWMNRYQDDFYGIITRNLEELEFLKQIGYSKRVIADSGLYVWNTQSVVVLGQYCDYNVLPLELNRRELLGTFGGRNGKDEPGWLSRMILPVYGRAPLMISANCVRRTSGKCLLELKREPAPEDSYCCLTDRKGTKFPVQTECSHCQNIIWNSVPTSLYKFMEDPVRKEAAAVLYSFTDESADEVRQVLQGTTEGLAFTTGHFRRGVE